MQNIRTFFKMFSQLYDILNRKQRRQSVALALNLMLVALLETLGVSVIIPFILAMLDPQQLMNSRYVVFLAPILNITTYKRVLFCAALAIVLVYILKNTIIIIANFVQARFRNNLEKDLSVLMLRSYLSKPYLFHINTNSSEVMRGITSDISGVATVVDSFSALLSEILTCILIGFFLLTLMPFMAMTILGLAGITALLIVILFRKKIALCGNECRESFKKRYQYAYQAINGIKEINIMHRQDNFIQFYEKASSRACKANTTYLCISKVPNRIVEVVFIGSLILLASVGVSGEGQAVTYVAKLGTMAVAAMRILPAISNIANCMNSLVYNRPALEMTYSNLKNVEIENSIISTKSDITEMRMMFNDCLCIKGLCWKYTPDGKNVLEDLSLEIKKGESIAFIGESGAGKTTLADIILGLFSPQKGQILMDGIDIYSIKEVWGKIVGYVPQNVFLLDDTVRNNIVFGIPADEIDEDRVWNAIRQAQLENVVETMSCGLDTVLGERGVKISGGQRQRIAIARALYYNPDILVLDEATSALDTDTERAVMESIEALQGHITLIIVAHRLSTIQKCNKIYEIGNGKATLKSYEEVFHERRQDKNN